MIGKLSLSAAGVRAALFYGIAGVLILAIGRPAVPLPVSGLLLALLAWLAAVDVERMLLPNELTLALILTGLGFGLMAGPEGLLASSLGAAIGYGLLSLVALAYRRLRGQDGLGGGDAKLLAGGGAWLGALQLPIVVLIASTMALAFVLIQRLRGREIALGMALPFGPFLASGIWLIWCFK